ENNLWWGFGAGNTIAEFAGGDDQEHTRIYLSDAANGNAIGDPELNGIDRADDGMALDPRPNLNGMAYKMAKKNLSNDAWFSSTNYVGAFGAGLWIDGWTALAEHGYLRDGGVISPIEDDIFDAPNSISLDQNYPNPFNPSTNISFALPTAQNITLKVYDMLGREVATLFNNQRMSAGQQTVSFDASGLSSGVYIYQLVGANTSITKRMTLIK
ncbi:MAG: T9SS type A sorting domain-containing protein, partial [Balneolaceae bacterium]